MKRKLIWTLAFLLTGCHTVRIIETNVTEKLTMKVKNEKPEGSHPNYDDKSTLYWYRDSTFEDALKKGKFVLVEFGRAG